MQRNLSHGASADDCQVTMASRLKAGDESVLLEILSAFGPRVASLLGRVYPDLAGCPDDTDEILAETLYRLWENREVFDPKRTPLRRWFYILAEHITIDRFKYGWQKSRQREVSSCGQDVENVAGDESEATDETACMPQDQRDISEIVCTLSIIDQKILSVHASSEEGEYWAADLAGEIGMKAGAIRVRLTRIHEKIEKEMNQRGYNFKRVKRSVPRTILIKNVSENR